MLAGQRRGAVTAFTPGSSFSSLNKWSQTISGRNTKPRSSTRGAIFVWGTRLPVGAEEDLTGLGGGARMRLKVGLSWKKAGTYFSANQVPISPSGGFGLRTGLPI